MGVELAFPQEEAIFEVMAFSVGRNQGKKAIGKLLVVLHLLPEIKDLILASLDTSH